MIPEEQVLLLITGILMGLADRDIPTFTSLKEIEVYLLDKYNVTVNNGDLIEDAALNIAKGIEEYYKNA